MTSRKDINDRLTRTNIKGRDYIDVAQRVQGFWELYPMGRILTEMVADDGKRCVFRAEVYDMSEGGAGLLATGHAYEVNNGRGVNATSYIENCETSAVGRALGMLGIGSTDSIASADEVSAAMQAQTASKPAQKPAGAARKPAEAKKNPKNEAIKRLREACDRYEAAHPQEDRPKGWAYEGSRMRRDRPAEDAPADVWVEWLDMVAGEFEASL